MTSTPPDENGVIKISGISFTHLSPLFRGFLLAIMLIGGAGGGWHLVGRAQNVISPAPVAASELERIHQLELEAVATSTTLKLLISQRERTDKAMLDRMKALEQRIDLLISAIRTP